MMDPHWAIYFSYIVTCSCTIDFTSQDDMDTLLWETKGTEMNQEWNIRMDAKVSICKLCHFTGQSETFPLTTKAAFNVNVKPLLIVIKTVSGLHFAQASALTCATLAPTNRFTGTTLLISTEFYSSRSNRSLLRNNSCLTVCDTESVQLVLFMLPNRFVDKTSPLTTSIKEVLKVNVKV